MNDSLCKIDRKKNSGSLQQFPLTFTQQYHTFILRERKFNFSGNRGSMTSVTLSMLISSRGGEGKGSVGH